MNVRILTVVLCWFVTVNADRTSQKIYYDIHGFEACFRRLNATGQIGCSSKRGGNTGVVHYIETPADVAWLVDKGPHKPYVALLTPETFTWEVVSKLRESGKINGMLVIHTNESSAPDKFSPDLPCPNDLNSLYKDDPEYAHCKAQKWNPDANSLFFQDYEFPIMALTNSTEITEGLLEKCFEKFNKPQDGEAPSYPLCSAEMKIEMSAAVDSPSCMRRSRLNSLFAKQEFCSPLGYSSTYAFVHPINDPNTTKKHEVIVASARMDSFSMFENLYPAADSSVSGIVTLLAAAAALGKVKDTIDSETSKPIMFTILNGEAFDYIGSQRLVYDMLEDEFPWDASKRSEGPPLLKPTDIVQFLEMGQVALLDEGAMWAHTDPLADSKPQAVLDALMAASATVGLTVNEPPQSQPLPPASLQTFLQEASDIAGVVLTDHQAAFTNKYYNSMYDKPETINHVYPDGVNGTERYDYVTPAAKHLTLVANTVARTLFSLSTGNSDTEHVNVTELEVTHLLYCFMIDAKCDLFNESLSKNAFDWIPEGHMLKYYTLISYSPILIIERMLGYYLSNPLKLNETKCKEKKSDLYNYRWINGPVNKTSEDESRIGRCIEVTSNYTLAVSPAFEIKDYDYDSNKYSSWTESRWDDSALSLRIFLVPDPTKESAVLGAGIGLLVLSFFVMCLIRRKAKFIFATNTI